MMRTTAGLAALSLLVTTPALAQSAEEFYKGKSVSLIIGFSVGGGYDLYARHLGRHIGKHIPGQPTIVPQNMSGAGSLRAANFLYSAAPKDGTAFGTFARTTGICPNHLLTLRPDGRSTECRRLEMLPIECVVRGYLSGSGWKDYGKTGEVCGHRLPSGLREPYAGLERWGLFLVVFFVYFVPPVQRIVGGTMEAMLRGIEVMVTLGGQW